MKKVFVVLLSFSLCAACSAFRPSKESISVMTSQPDAVIYVNGHPIGQGSVTTQVKRNQNVQIVASKPGYYPGSYNIGSNLNTTGVLDIVGTFFFLFPIIGVFFPGAKSLDENNVFVNLIPQTTVNPNAN